MIFHYAVVQQKKVLLSGNDRECSLEETMGGHLTQLPTQIRSFDGHEILPVVISFLLCFWLDFSMLYPPLLYVANNCR